MKYIILDTNCFLEAIRDSKSMHFDYDGIKYYARNQGVYIVITAYTLYEIIKGLRKLPDIEEFRRQLIKFGDFYVLQNKILDHDFLEYGIDFLFLLKLHSNETMLEFADKQEELRKRVYKRLFNRMFFYTSLVSASYLLLSNTDTDGEFDWDTRLKCDFILNHFWNVYKEIFSEKFENYYEHAGYRSYDFTNKEFFDDYDAKDKLREYLIELIIEILSIADARVMVHNNEIEKSTQAFNEKIRERRPIRKHEITMDCFRKANLRAKRLTNNKRSIENVLDLILSDIKDSLKKDCYRLLVERLFNSGGFGKSINNDFTDFSNLILLESFNPGEAVYLTYEKSWLSFLESHKDNPFVIDTITFCKKYEVGTS